MEHLNNSESSMVLEDLESRRLMTAGGVTDAATEIPAQTVIEAEIVLSYDGLDPIIASMISAPETIAPEEWRVLERRFVVPNAARGAVPVPAPTKPSDMLPADQFRLYANGNRHHFADNFAHLNVKMPHAFHINEPQTVAEIDFDRLRGQLRYAVHLGAGAVIDIEHLPIDVSRFGEATVLKSMEIYQAVIDVARAEFPDLEIGFYGSFPQRDLWTPLNYRAALNAVQTNGDPWLIGNLDKFTDRYLEWQKSNDFLAPWAAQVDVIYPSLYTFSEDRQAWQYYAEENIKQAARYGKPVVPFLWNRYHNGFAERSRDLIEPEFWRSQLDTVRRLSAGVFIFDDAVDPIQPVAGHTSDYTMQHQWYAETVDFFQDVFDDAQVDLH